jgi:hypothetical protein
MWREGLVGAMQDAAAFGDGVALACGMLDRAAPAVIAGTISVALRVTARFLQGRGRP